jgi:hypothetical protein
LPGEERKAMQSDNFTNRAMWAHELSKLSFIASSDDSPPALLREIFIEIKSSGRAQVLLEQLALNCNTDLDLLTSLASDASPIVRASVARNPKAIALIWKLAKDENDFVRFELAATTHFPVHLYESLARDKEPRVASRAKRTLRALKRSDSLVGNIASMVDSIMHYRKAS